MEPITIDGSRGEGGGQILRSSISVAMLERRPIRIVNIRAGRKKPGLMRQHLTSLRAAAEISQAQLRGDTLGSTEIFFYPQVVSSGQYHFSIGTAGSTTLIMQTLLPALIKSQQPSEIIFEGGTHNGMSPSFTFVAESFLPILKTMGVNCKLDIDSYGFYPAGGGRWKIVIEPCAELRPIQLTGKPEWESGQIEAVISNKLNRQIAEREVKTAKRFLNLRPVTSKITVAPSPGPGNTVHISACSQGLAAMVEVTGEKHLRAETVAKRAATRFNQFIASGARVDEYLADQLLLYMIMAGSGAFSTVKPTLHTETNMALLQQLTGRTFSVSERNNCYQIAIDRRIEDPNPTANESR